MTTCLLLITTSFCKSEVKNLGWCMFAVWLTSVKCFTHIFPFKWSTPKSSVCNYEQTELYKTEYTNCLKNIMLMLFFIYSMSFSNPHRFVKGVLEKKVSRTACPPSKNGKSCQVSWGGGVLHFAWLCNSLYKLPLSFTLRIIPRAKSNFEERPPCCFCPLEWLWEQGGETAYTASCWAMHNVAPHPTPPGKPLCHAFNIWNSLTAQS